MGALSELYILPRMFRKDWMCELGHLFRYFTDPSRFNCGDSTFGAIQDIFATSAVDITGECTEYAPRLRVKDSRRAAYNFVISALVSLVMLRFIIFTILIRPMLFFALPFLA